MDADELLSIRKEVGLSQDKFAERLGVGIRTYQKWEGHESPIRPMVAQSVRNLVELIKNEHRIRQAKSTLEKLEGMRSALLEAVNGVRALGAADRIAQRIVDTLEKNKAPSVEEVRHMLGTVKNPKDISAVASAILKILIVHTRDNPAINDDVSHFRYMIQEILSAEEAADFEKWAEENYVMTSPDVVASTYRAVIKQLGALGKGGSIL